ncbi:MAG: galactose mutarotase [Sphingomonas sp.]|nr:galactose mutarotase [Sphingomonas sp.]
MIEAGHAGSETRQSAGAQGRVSAVRAPMGVLADGRLVEKVTLANANGISATVMTLGATLQALHVPDRDGVIDDIVLGHDTPDEYLARVNYFGVTVGRYANRIAHGRFTLDGRDYQLETNDGPHHLHGGLSGFDRKLWTITSVGEGEEAHVELTLVSSDGEGGYPGTLRVTARYTLDDRDQLRIDYRATTDAPTIVNLTNHALFNLAGERARGDVLTHKLTLHASRYTPVDPTLIPTGELAPVAGTAFDFAAPRAIGEAIRDGNDAQIRIGRGYDHNFVIDGTPGTLRPAALVEDPASGRAMEMLVTAPGVQVYSGNFLDGTVAGKGGRLYRQSDGLALEPQCFPDSPNRPDFPSSRLDPDMEYVNTMLLRFSQAVR